MKTKLYVFLLMVIFLSSISYAALYMNTCWQLSNGTVCFNGTSGTNILTGIKINASNVLNLNVSGSPGGSGVNFWQTLGTTITPNSSATGGIYKLNASIGCGNISDSVSNICTLVNTYNSSTNIWAVVDPYNYYNSTGTGLQFSGHEVSVNFSSLDERYAHGNYINYFYNTSTTETYYLMNSTLPQTTTQKMYEVDGLADGQLIQSWINEKTNLSIIPNGIIHYHFHIEKSVGAQNLQVYALLYKNTSIGEETLLSTSENSSILPLAAEQDTDIHSVINDILLNSSDRLVVKLKAGITGIGLAPNIQIFIEGDTGARIELPFIQGSIATSEADPFYFSNPTNFITFSSYTGNNSLNNLSIWTVCNASAREIFPINTSDVNFRNINATNVSATAYCNATVCKDLSAWGTASAATDLSNYYQKTDWYALNQTVNGMKVPYAALDIRLNASASMGNLRLPSFNIGLKSNNILQSESFDSATWLKSANVTTVVANGIISPLGTLTAEMLNGTDPLAVIYQVTANTSNSSCWNLNFYAVRLGGLQNNITVRLNTTVWGGVNITLNLTPEWKAYSITTNTSGISPLGVTIYLGKNNISIWGIQLDYDTCYMRSYYPTTTAVVVPTVTTYSGVPLTINGLLTAVGISAGGTIIGASTGAFSAAITNTIATAFISTDGIVETSTTAATAAAPIQKSPRLRFSGTVWDISKGATRTVNWINEINPVVAEDTQGSHGELLWGYGYNDVTDIGIKKLMILSPNGSLSVAGDINTSLNTSVLNCWNFTSTCNTSFWNINGGWTFVSNMTRYQFSLGATGNLTQNISLFNIVAKPNRQYQLSYNVSGTGVAGCLAFIPTTFAQDRIYLPGVSLTTANVFYDVNFKTNSNPGNFTISALCTAGSFYLDDLDLREIQTGDITANGKFTGGGTEGIKIDELGNVNITQNLTIANWIFYNNNSMLYIKNGSTVQRLM